jgi:hypothetical protein
MTRVGGDVFFFGHFQSRDQKWQVDFDHLIKPRDQKWQVDFDHLRIQSRD